MFEFLCFIFCMSRQLLAGRPNSFVFFSVNYIYAMKILIFRNTILIRASGGQEGCPNASEIDFILFNHGSPFPFHSHFLCLVPHISSCVSYVFRPGRSGDDIPWYALERASLNQVRLSFDAVRNHPLEPTTFVSDPVFHIYPSAVENGICR